MILNIKKLDPNAIIPTKNNQTDAGIDLYALEDTEIKPGFTVKVRTGISIQLQDIPEGKIYTHLIWDRSGLGSKGIHRLAGVIDQEYTGEIVVCLTNLNVGQVLESVLSRLEVGDMWSLIGNLQYMHSYTYFIKKGDKIAQFLVQEVVPIEIKEVNELNSTVRGDKGFGSSGK